MEITLCALGKDEDVSAISPPTGRPRWKISLRTKAAPNPPTVISQRKKTSRFRLVARRNLDVFLIIKNREIKTKTPKTKYHSPIKVTALKKIVKNGVRICSTKFRVEISNCLIKSIFILYNKKKKLKI